MNRQLPLDFVQEPDFSAAAFLNGRCNSEARNVLAAPEAWSNHTLALVGPKGCGKTHLGHIWAHANAAICLDGNQEFIPRAEWKGRALWIDNASRADEFTLFTLMNLAITGELDFLLLSDRDYPGTWSVQVPDVHSRLKNTQMVWLEQPDHDLLCAIVEKLFKDRGLKVSDTLISYLLANTERSVDALRALVIELDQVAVSEKANVTRTFAAKYLQSKLF